MRSRVIGKMRRGKGPPQRFLLEVPWKFRHHKWIERPAIKLHCSKYLNRPQLIFLYIKCHGISYFGRNHDTFALSGHERIAGGAEQGREEGDGSGRAELHLKAFFRPTIIMLTLALSRVAIKIIVSFNIDRMWPISRLFFSRWRCLRCIFPC